MLGHFFKVIKANLLFSYLAQDIFKVLLFEVFQHFIQAVLDPYLLCVMVCVVQIQPSQLNRAVRLNLKLPLLLPLKHFYLQKRGVNPRVDHFMNYAINYH